MTLKNRISLYISLLFTVVFALSTLIIGILFSNFRQEEFKGRLREKALSSIILLTQVREMDKHLLRVVDQNSINQLYNEKTLIFDPNYHLIYSSVDDAVVRYDINDFRYIKEHGSLYRKQDELEIYGFFYDSDNNDYYALIAAEDKQGNRKLRYLGLVLLVTFASCTLVVWVITFRLSSRLLNPLENFLKRIANIYENSLDHRLELSERKHNDEIYQLAREFNLMMERIESSYKNQKDFNAYASHELRTPLARLSAKIENKKNEAGLPAADLQFLNELDQELHQLSDLIHSLLLLTRTDGTAIQWPDRERLDEIIFTAFEKTQKLYPDFRMEFELDPRLVSDGMPELAANHELLGIVCRNLLRNACLYSDDRRVRIHIYSEPGCLLAAFSNTGAPLGAMEKEHIFEPFIRGQNAAGHSGLGLGLRISQRIMQAHRGSISYETGSTGEHIFILRFQI